MVSYSSFQVVNQPSRLDTIVIIPVIAYSRISCLVPKWGIQLDLHGRLTTLKMHMFLSDLNFFSQLVCSTGNHIT